jgi:hypothetical protein
MAVSLGDQFLYVATGRHTCPSLDSVDLLDLISNLNYRIIDESFL